MPDRSAVQAAGSTIDAPATGAAAPRRRTWGTAPLAVRLAVILLAVVATLTHLGPAVQTPLWLAAAVAVALGFLAPGEGVDWMGRTLGLGVAAIILVGTALDAAGFALTSQTWAIVLGLVAMGAVVLSHRRPVSGVAARPGTDGPAPEAAAPVARRTHLVWGAAAALVAVAALAWAGITGRPVAPDMEMWLTDSAQASASAPAGAAPTALKVSVRSGVDVSDARLTVTTGSSGPAPSAGVSVPAGATPGPQFALGSGQTVEQTVTVPAAGHVEIRLTSASRPEVNRILVLNR